MMLGFSAWLGLELGVEVGDRVGVGVRVGVGLELRVGAGVELGLLHRAQGHVRIRVGVG
jgi:hypothetical protein